MLFDRNDLLTAANDQHTPYGEALVAAARALSTSLPMDMAVTKPRIKSAMIKAFGGSDAEGAWSWRDAWNACEVAMSMHLLRFGPVLGLERKSPSAALADLEALQALFPTHTVRSEEQMALQQFSTPAAYAYLTTAALQLSPGDLVLEPSAGLGGLATFARIAGSSLILNELSETRAAALNTFLGLGVTSFDAAAIDDRLDPKLRPTAVLMNPPFSVSASVGADRGASTKHVLSAFRRLRPGGRLSTIVQGGLSPSKDWAGRFYEKLLEEGSVILNAEVDGSFYKKHGTTIDTRLIVVDKDGRGNNVEPTRCDTLGDLSEQVFALPCRGAIASDESKVVIPLVPKRQDRRLRPAAPAAKTERPSNHSEPTQLTYTEREEAWAEDQDSGLYQRYSVRRIAIKGAEEHKSALTQSASLAGVRPPLPSYKPTFPKAVTENALLSDAQLETIIYAGEAHNRLFDGRYRWDEEKEELVQVADTDMEGKRVRCGYFLGDGTGVGKGRQVAGLILDNWMQGRKRAIWLSKTESLLEDAKRDWTALGGRSSDIHLMKTWKPGEDIGLREGIIFITYATLRSIGRSGDRRIDQLVRWAGEGYDGVIAFDETHEMAGALGGEGSRGKAKGSHQGRAGVELQGRLPGARVLYVSATGATVVENLAYADRLGLWRGAGAPFVSAVKFAEEMHSGGVAAMEMVCRDLVSLGLYVSRNLSFEGVEYEMLEHKLTTAQKDMWKVYAEAFQVLHQNLAKTLEAIGVVAENGSCINGNAKGQAISAFESMKQRFFGALLTACKMPTVLKDIEHELEGGKSCVIQIVSTGEAALERKLAEVTPQELAERGIDVSPKEAIMDYLIHAFPVQAHEERTDENGKLYTVPATDHEGRPVISQQALRIRQGLLERMGMLPAITTALDQLIWHFGADKVAEVTGRSRRIIKRRTGLGEEVIVDKRGSRAGSAETTAFMTGQKKILVFSAAGGTGRSYHADLSQPNQDRRAHYLLEPGWRADAAVQGLGRTHRTNQASAPLFKPVVTDVKGEKRFSSTISRKLDSLGALTKGERKTGGQGLFRPEDNLESAEAQDALRMFLNFVRLENIPELSCDRFETMTGLTLVNQDGSHREELPPIRQFLNRILALPIDDQNHVFGHFERMIAQQVEEAREAGTLDVGMEVLTADRLAVESDDVLTTDDLSGAETRLVQIERYSKTQKLTSEEAIARYRPFRFMVNEKSGRAAIVMPWDDWTHADGRTIDRVQLIRPAERLNSFLHGPDFEKSHFREVPLGVFRSAWDAEFREIPELERDRFAMVCGLILPLWKHLPKKGARVYRLTTDEGRTLLGRKIDIDVAAKLSETFGKELVELSPEDMADAIRDGREITIGKLTIRDAIVMHDHRFEVVGAEPCDFGPCKAAGCFSELIAYQTRLFLPKRRGELTQVIGRLLERYRSTVPVS
jgi:hypothetical protein